MQRYGRNTIYGMGYFEPIPLSDLGPPVPPIPGEFITCEDGNALIGVDPANSNAGNCTTEG